MEKARDKVVLARGEAEKARKSTERTKEKAEQEAYEIGVAETETNLRAQVPLPGYAGSIAPKFGLKPSIRLGLRLCLNLGG